MKDRKMNGLNPTSDKSTKFDSVINMTNANYDKCTGSDWFIMDADKVRLKTAAELKIDADALAKENGRTEAKQIRQEALHNCTVELNGNVFQTRPSDESNFRLSIAGMEDGDKEEWILANNTIVEVTKADLEQVYILGLKEATAIYATYKEALKAL